MSGSLIPFLPQDRRRAIARAETLPDHTQGTALFADISGFTPLTESLTQSLGAQRGAEELTRQLNRVYAALISQVHHMPPRARYWNQVGFIRRRRAIFCRYRNQARV